MSPTSEPPWLLADTLEYLIELGGTRVESQSLTHGVVITDALTETPRLSVPYPSGLRAAKRSPLLFDSQRSVLIVDHAGRARTELQWHRLERLLSSANGLRIDDTTFVDSGSLVALATRRLGGDRVFPPGGPQHLDLRRHQFDPPAMRPETRLHHLIDATDMDAQTLARLAALDGATIVDRTGQLLAYGAIVSSADSQHEGARTAAARSPRRPATPVHAACRRPTAASTPRASSSPSSVFTSGGSDGWYTASRTRRTTVPSSRTT